ncbi:MAG: hypothetical protein KIS85_01335 [Anaerolineales bacterium]|nr:hypothetical protein [Anaerolineales bacterium]
MAISDFLKGLIIDSWYKAFVYIGGLVFISSLFVEIKGTTNLTNGQLQAISSGIILLGLGEWKNHKTKSTIKPPNVYTGPAAFISWTEWDPDLLGLLLDFLGLILVVRGIWSLLAS